MTTVAEVDSLVQKDDAVAARIWPRLGAKVRAAYLNDRDAWVVARRDLDAGKQPSAQELAAHYKAFAGWSRAFHAASTRSRRATPIAAAPPPTVALPVPPGVAPVPVAAVTRASLGGAGTAVAGGLVLAGVLALAARRKRA